MIHRGNEARNIRSDFKLAWSYLRHGAQHISHLLLRTSRPLPSSSDDWRAGCDSLVFDQDMPRTIRTRSAPYSHYRRLSKELVPDWNAIHEFKKSVQQHAGEIPLRQQELGRNFKETSDRRYESLRSREQLKSSLDFLGRDLLAVFTILPQVQSGDIQPLNLSHLQIQLESAQRSYDQIILNVAQLQESEIALLQKEDVLRNRSAQFAELIAAFVKDIGLLENQEYIPPYGFQLDVDKKPPSDAPSLLTSYFDRRGDILILREQQTELEMTHLELTQEREFLRDHDEELSTTDEAFEERYRATWLEYAEQLKLAEHETSILESACRSRGLDTSLTYRSSVDSASAAGSDDRPEKLASVGGPFEVVPEWLDHIP